MIEALQGWSVTFTGGLFWYSLWCVAIVTIHTFYTLTKQVMKLLKKVRLKLK